MTVAPLIAMKSTKCESLEAVGKELDRRAHTYANDVDQSGRHVGYLCRAGDESPVPLEQAIERRRHCNQRFTSFLGTFCGLGNRAWGYGGACTPIIALNRVSVAFAGILRGGCGCLV